MGKHKERRSYCSQVVLSAGKSDSLLKCTYVVSDVPKVSQVAAALLHLNDRGTAGYPLPAYIV